MDLKKFTQVFYLKNKFLGTCRVDHLFIHETSGLDVQRSALVSIKHLSGVQLLGSAVAADQVLT